MLHFVFDQCVVVVVLLVRLLLATGAMSNAEKGETKADLSNAEKVEDAEADVWIHLITQTHALQSVYARSGPPPVLETNPDGSLIPTHTPRWCAVNRQVVYLEEE